ncbi:MAG: futalosine hydrolase [Bacteroidia bacterium]
MKRILIVAATYPEIKFLEKTGLKKIEGTSNLFSFINKETGFNVLITGVGMVATTFHLTQHLSKNNYDLILNTGIAGTFDKTISLSETVNIVEDCFADLGAEDDENYLTAFDLGLINENEFPFENGVLKNKTQSNFETINQLKKVKGITVNKVHGNEKSVERFLNDKLQTKNQKPITESMEGAAFSYVCMMMNIPHFQIRAVSNYIEKRNRNAWKIKEALESLESVLLKLIGEISG